MGKGVQIVNCRYRFVELMHNKNETASEWAIGHWPLLLTKLTHAPILTGRMKA